MKKSTPGIGKLIAVLTLLTGTRIRSEIFLRGGKSREYVGLFTQNISRTCYLLLILFLLLFLLYAGDEPKPHTVEFIDTGPRKLTTASGWIQFATYLPTDTLCSTPTGFEAYKLGACDPGYGRILTAVTDGINVYVNMSSYSDSSCSAKSYQHSTSSVFASGACTKYDTDYLYGYGAGSLVPLLTPNGTVAGS
jgi:hypothetical protein